MNWTTYNNAGAALSQSLTDMPVGTITGYAGTTAPSGWLLCDGAAVSRSDYAELFGVVGTTYGSGNGSTTFNVPDSSGFIILASSQAARLAAAALPQYVTSLPSSPVDGQTVVYAADAANGVMWTLRYRAASSSSYKWEFVGGQELSTQSMGQAGPTSISANTWGNISNAISITAPLSGDYKIHAVSSVYSGYTGANNIGIKVNTTEEVLTSATDMPAGEWNPTSIAGVVTGVSSNNAISLRYRPGGTANMYRIGAYLGATPVRVG